LFILFAPLRGTTSPEIKCSAPAREHPGAR
jgi:hypothetical protein